MTAAELFDVVKDVPREAWPEGIKFTEYGWIDTTYGCYTSNPIAESAFVGSMTADRLSKCDVVETVQRVDGIFMVKTSAGTFKWKSLVAALAAACKEAA